MRIGTARIFDIPRGDETFLALLVAYLEPFADHTDFLDGEVGRFQANQLLGDRDAAYQSFRCDLGLGTEGKFFSWNEQHCPSWKGPGCDRGGGGRLGCC